MNPWEASEHRAPERATLVRNVLAFRDQLDPWLPFPQNACCFSFGEDSRPLPLGALFILWERWPAITGPCPVCGGQGYGVGFLGFLATGRIYGVCIDCEASLIRCVGGFCSLADEIRPILKGGPYYLNRGVMWGTFEGLRAPLVAALQSLGARDLPDEAWAREREGGGAGLTIQTNEGPVNVSFEVDAEPVLVGSNGTSRLLYPTRQVRVSEAGPARTRKGAAARIAERYRRRRERESRGKKTQDEGRRAWPIWLPIVLALSIAARSLSGNLDPGASRSDERYQDGIGFQVPAPVVPTFPAGYFKALFSTPTPDPHKDVAEERRGTGSGTE